MTGRNVLSPRIGGGRTAFLRGVSDRKGVSMTPEMAQSPSDDLNDQVRRWVAAGIVTAEQGERILQLERSGLGDATAVGGLGAPSVRPLSRIAELVSYLGIVLVLASGGLFVNRLWHGLGLGGRMAVGVVVALLGFLGGRAVTRLDDEATTRLGWLLWLCGTGGVAMSTAVLVDRVASHNAGWTMFVTGLVVLAVSMSLWRNLERPLQFLGSVAGFGVSVVGIASLASWGPDSVIIGLLLWIAGVTLGLFALKIVHPALTATLVAQGGLFIGALVVISSNSRAIGFVLGLLGAAAGVGLGLSKRQMPIVAAGVVSFFVFVVRFLSFYLRGPVTILVAFVLGVGLVAVVIWRATRLRSATSGEGSEVNPKGDAQRPH